MFYTELNFESVNVVMVLQLGAFLFDYLFVLLLGICSPYRPFMYLHVFFYVGCVVYAIC